MSPCRARGQAPSQEWKRGGGREALVDASQKQPMTMLVPFALIRLSSGTSQESLPWKSSSCRTPSQ